MKAHKPLIVAILLAGSAFAASSQNLEPFKPYGMINPSVQSYKMARYGQESPSLYNGSMSSSIPVYIYSDPDFTIPISLDYHFDGFRPSEDSGLVGYGWILNCGGIITREVRGLPDDYLPNPNYGDNRYGFLMLPKNKCYRVTSQTNRVLTPNTRASLPSQLLSNLSPLKLSPFLNLYSSEDCFLYDTESDIYHFSIPGHHGSFYIAEDGKITMSESDLPPYELKVKMTPPCRDMSGIASIDFEITTGDGYVYVFKPLEISVSVNEIDLVDDLDFKEIPKSYTGYRLVQIIAPNKRTVDFQYRAGSVQASFTVDTHYSTITNNEIEYGSPLQNVYSLNGTAILESILVDGKTVVSFTYDIPNNTGEIEDICFCSTANCTYRFKHLYGGSSMMEKVKSLVQYGPNVETLQLSGIYTFNAEKDTVFRTTFNYQYTSGTPKRLLSSMNTNSGTYSFEYKTDLSIPVNDTQSTDHWGYWNAWPSDRRVYLDASINQGNLHIGNRYDQFRTEYADWKSASPSNAMACAMTKITYPTGGWATIEYEGNLVGKRINGLVPSLEECQNYTVGGVRVRRISNYSDIGKIVDFSLYKYDFPDGESSGILQAMPVYAVETFHSYQDPEHYMIFQDDMASWLDVHTIAYMNSCSAARAKDGHVAYSSVSVEHADGSNEEYKFSSYNEYPDRYEDFEIHSTRLSADADMYKNVFYYHDRIEHTGQLYSLFPPVENMFAVPIICPPSGDHSGCRGKIKEKTVYDKEGNMLRRESYTYREASNMMGYPIHDFVYKFKKCISTLHWLYIGTKTETVYNSGVGLFTRLEYEYSHGGQINAERIASPTDTMTTYYGYNQDCN